MYKTVISALLLAGYTDAIHLQDTEDRGHAAWYAQEDT